MVKFVETKVVFEEIPDRVTLAVTISNCPFHCIGCHSEYLRDNVGEELTYDKIDMLLKENKGVNCFLFLGDGNNVSEICELAKYIQNKHVAVDTAIYSGYDLILNEYLDCFDYIKVGKYIEEYGPLNSKTTNQRLFKKINGDFEDITYKFWNRLEPTT